MAGDICWEVDHQWSDEAMDLLPLARRYSKQARRAPGKKVDPQRRALKVGKRSAYVHAWKRWEPFREGLDGYTEMQFNVYENAGDFIGWHRDPSDGLLEPCMLLSSFALNEEDEDKVLGHLLFRDMRDKPRVLLDVPLRHGTVLEFDVEEHRRLGIQHAVLETLRPRMSVVLRKMKTKGRLNTEQK